jgi:hypothetical protein
MPMDVSPGPDKTVGLCTLLPEATIECSHLYVASTNIAVPDTSASFSFFPVPSMHILP